MTNSLSSFLLVTSLMFSLGIYVLFCDEAFYASNRIETLRQQHKCLVLLGPNEIPVKRRLRISEEQPEVCIEFSIFLAMQRAHTHKHWLLQLC